MKRKVVSLVFIVLLTTTNLSLITPVSSSKNLGSYDPRPFISGDSIGMIFTHEYDSMQVLPTKYLMADVVKPTIPHRLNYETQFYIDDSYITEPRDDGFRIYGHELSGGFIRYDFDMVNERFYDLVTFNMRSSLIDYFDYTGNHLFYEIKDVLVDDGLIYILGIARLESNMMFVVTLDKDLLLLDIDSFDTLEGAFYTDQYHLMMANETFMLFDDDLSDQRIYSGGWLNWNQTLSRSCNTFADCYFINKLENRYMTYVIDDETRLIQIRDTANLSRGNEFDTGYNSFNDDVAIIKSNDTHPYFTSAIIRENSIELWGIDGETEDVELLTIVEDELIDNQNTPFIQEDMKTSSILITSTDYWIFWDQIDPLGVNEIFYAKISLDFSSAEVKQLTFTDRITDDVVNYDLGFELILEDVIRWTIVLIVILSAFAFYYKVVRGKKPELTEMDGEDLDYPEH